MAVLSDTRHPSLLRAEETLLLVVDMQEPFLREVWKRERVVHHTRFLIDCARVLSVPILATVQYAEKMGGIVTQVAERLTECSPIDKLCFSCASDEALMRALSDSGRRQVLICGVETHICVCQTALDLIHRGFQVHLAADSVSSRAESTHKIGLDKMRQAGVILTSSEGAVYEMTYTAGTPQFKEVLQLVKNLEAS